MSYHGLGIDMVGTKAPTSLLASQSIMTAGKVQPGTMAAAPATLATAMADIKTIADRALANWRVDGTTRSYATDAARVSFLVATATTPQVRQAALAEINRVVSGMQSRAIESSWTSGGGREYIGQMLTAVQRALTMAAPPTPTVMTDAFTPMAVSSPHAAEPPKDAAPPPPIDTSKRFAEPSGPKAPSTMPEPPKDSPPVVPADVMPSDFSYPDTVSVPSAAPAPIQVPTNQNVRTGLFGVSWTWIGLGAGAVVLAGVGYSMTRQKAPTPNRRTKRRR